MVAASGTMLQAGRLLFQIPMTSSDFFSNYLILQAALLASNRNEYQESSWGVKGGRRVKTNNLTAISKPIF
jgi:hypothetical protein